MFWSYTWFKFTGDNVSEVERMLKIYFAIANLKEKYISNGL